MKIPFFGKRSRTKGVSRVASVAMIAFVLAMMVLPLATTSGVSAADDDDKPTINFNGNGPIIDVEPDPTTVPITLSDDVEVDLGEDEPEIEIPVDIDIPVDQEDEPQIDLPTDVDIIEDEDQDPRIEGPVDIDVMPEAPVIDLPDCVDTDGGEVIYLPGGIDLLDERTLRLPDGVSYDFLQDSPSIEDVFGDLFLREGVTIKLPPGVDLDLESGQVIIPECDDAGEPPIIRIPPGFEIDLDGEDDGLPPVIDLPQCVENDQDAIIRFPPGTVFEVDPETGDVLLPPGFDLDFDFQLAERDGAEELDPDFSNGLTIRLTADVTIDLDGDEPIIDIPLCDGDEENADETGYVTIHKWACDAGVSIQDPELETLRDECAAFEGVTFDLHNTNVDLEASESQTTDVDGLAIWSVEKPNHLTITETMPDGYIETVVVFCGVIQGTGQFPQSLSLVDAPGGVLAYDLGAGAQLYCDWFNRAERGVITIPVGNTVTIIKHDCPEGFDAYNSDPDGLAANCDSYLDGVEFNVSDFGPINETASTGEAGPGKVFFNGLDAGEYVVTETIPDAYGEPVVYCALTETGAGEPADYARYGLYGEGQIFSVLASDDAIWCHWFNVPGGYEDVDEGGNVVIFKFECPDAPDLSGFDYDSTPEGCVPLPGIEFTLSYGIDTILTETTSDAEAAVGYYGLPATTVSISEALPAGYGDPIVTCLSAYQSDAGSVQEVYTPNMTGTGFAYDLKDNENLYCYWLNIPYEDDGSITIVKFTCAPSYDLHAQGANPEYDCPDTTDGVVFSLDTPVDSGLQGVTGTSGDGTLTFDGLPAGSYTISEQVPDGTDSVFVLSCQSEKAKWVQGYPLSTGSDFTLDLLSGDIVVCSWYNVPEEPDYGTIEIIKYACPTATFVDRDDCERYEDGVSFHLSVWTDSGWAEAAEGTTNSNGVLIWYGLDPGTYEIDEIGGKWCYASADRTDEDGNLVVVAGEVTTVWVYNCGKTVITKKPTKFPNTGVGQMSDTGTTPSGANAPVSPAGDEDLADLGKRNGFFGRLIDSVLRAGKPAELRIASIDVDARIETLEIVNGGLQDPTTADQVAWYKDTAKLGEDGNVVMAGHLNYWGVPEGVFFHLTDLVKGDEIEVVAQNGTVFRYQVDWVKQIAIDGDVASLVGETDEPSLTLITCGGQWDDSIQEYDHRTVVRATLITEA